MKIEYFNHLRIIETHIAVSKHKEDMIVLGDVNDIIETPELQAIEYNVIDDAAITSDHKSIYLHLEIIHLEIKDFLYEFRSKTVDKLIKHKWNQSTALSQLDKINELNQIYVNISTAIIETLNEISEIMK